MDEAAWEKLSGREAEVLRRYGAGEAAGKIAAAMGLSVKTVSTFLTRAQAKLKLQSRYELRLAATPPSELMKVKGRVSA